MAVYPLNQSRASLVILSALIGMGNPLACLIALALLGPLPVTTETVATATKQDSRTAKRGLRCLEQMGFAINVPYAQSDGWLIATQALQSPLLVDLMLSATNALSSSPVVEKINELSTTNALSSLVSATNALSSPQSQSQLTNNNDSITDWPKTDAELEAAYLKVLASGPVYPNIRKPLAKQMASEGQGYLLHLLGHLALAKSGRHQGYDRPGVYLKDQALDRVEVPEAELPPAGLAFVDALKWALNGGKTQLQLVEEESARQAAATTAEIERAEAAARALAYEAERAAEESARLEAEAAERTRFAGDPLYRLWQTTLAQLRLETTADVYRTWLADTQLATDTDGNYVVQVPNAYTKDWLANRLAGTIKRTLASAGGDDRPLRFEVKQKDS